MFADDINVLIADSDIGSLQNKIDRVMAELETWFNRNKLVINAEKTLINQCRFITDKQIFW